MQLALRAAAEVLPLAEGAVLTGPSGWSLGEKGVSLEKALGFYETIGLGFICVYICIEEPNRIFGKA